MAGRVKQYRGDAVVHGCRVSDAIADALRGEIVCGRYRAGKCLPSVDDLRGRFSAGEYAVRRALHKLRDEGLVDVKKHVGVVAKGGAGRRWKGHVLFINYSVACSFSPHRLAVQLAMRFEASGWAMHTVFFPARPDGSCDLEPVMRHLANAVSFAVIVSEFPQIAELLDRAGVPYLVINGYTREFPKARAVIGNDSHGGYADLIAFLRQKGAKSLLEVDYDRRMDRAFKSQLAEAGIAVRRLLCKWENVKNQNLREVRRMGHAAVARFLSAGAKMPDAVLFDDDYLASGGVIALLQAGVRIPEDLLVVTMSNRGNEMLVGVPHSRIEHDPVACGDAVAKYVLALLAGRRAKIPRCTVRFMPQAQGC